MILTLASVFKDSKYRCVFDLDDQSKDAKELVGFDSNASPEIKPKVESESNFVLVKLSKQIFFSYQKSNNLSLGRSRFICNFKDLFKSIAILLIVKAPVLLGKKIFNFDKNGYSILGFDLNI